jgi:processing peptidase subunit beta
MVVDFQQTNYFGDNMVVVGTGNVNHDQLVDLVDKHFSTIPKKNPKPINNLDKPIYNPALLFIRDDEMVNSNVGVFYDAPDWKHPDFYAFLLL